MPSQNERFSKKSQTSSLAKTVESQAINDSARLLDALTFIESPQGLNTVLYPVQRVIIRCLYGIPFDERIEIPKYKTIKIWDEFKDNLITEFTTEEEFLHWAYEEGKCNIKDWRDIPEGGFREGVIFAGRRGGKSQLVAAIGAYELYRLLSLHDPQKYYDLKTSDIDFTFLAQDDKGASRLYTAMQGAINETPFFTPYIRVNTNAVMKFVSEADRDRRDILPTIKVVALPCTTNAVRGPSSRFLALDEFAHFASKKGATSEEVYAAATPATSNFVNPVGKNEDMILCISSPWKKIGKMYDLWKAAMDEGLTGIPTKLALNIGTSIMNPRITASKLHNEYKENTMTYRAEFGGSFLDSAESYVRKAAFQPCVDAGRQNSVGFNQKNLGREFFWGLDLGMKNDATALAIGHFEFRSEFNGIGLVYDYIDRMMVGEKFTGPGIKPNIVGDEMGEKYAGKYTELPLPDVLAWLLHMNTIMPCTDGVTDQHGGSQLVQLLQMKGIIKMSLLHITPRINSQMFFALKGYIDNKGARFPDEPKFALEIGQVEAEMLNKYTLKVAAPMEKGAHDDMVDAAAMVAFVAQRYLNDHQRIKLDPSGMSFLLQEQQAQSKPLVIPDISGASLRDVRLAERLARIKRNTQFPGIETTQSPWNKKLGAGRRGRR
jgi:hypothetical protein